MTRQRNKERQEGKRRTKGNDKQGKTMNKDENRKTQSTNEIIVPQRFGNSGRKKITTLHRKQQKKQRYSTSKMSSEKHRCKH
jgi:hypothetical protein